MTRTKNVSVFEPNGATVTVGGGEKDDEDDTVTVTMAASGVG